MPADAFRAVYLRLCSADAQLPKGCPDPWAILPKEDYEVARLHYLWEGDEAAKPLGNRLLQESQRCGSALEAVLVVHPLGEKPSWNPTLGLTMAKKALTLAPCGKTYFRYADALSMFFEHDENNVNKREVAKYLDMYLKTAKKDDYELRIARTGRKWLRDRGF